LILKEITRIPARDFIRLSDPLRYPSNTPLSAASMGESGFESCQGTLPPHIISVKIAVSFDEHLSNGYPSNKR
jgi:hypothetical protein